jgi:hypothetical protein
VQIEALIWIRSLAIVLLIVAHALRHVQQEPEQPAPAAASALPPAPLVLTPELVDALCAALAQVTVAEEPPMQQALPSTQSEQETNIAQEIVAGYSHEQEEARKEQQESNYKRVKAYLAMHPKATDRDIAEALTMSTSTANKWRRRIQDEGK